MAKVLSASTIDSIKVEMESDDIQSESKEIVDHKAMLSNLNRSTGSTMYTFGDNIVQCSLFGPNPLASNLNLLKKNYFSVFLYPLGKIRNMTKDKEMFYYEHFFKRTFGLMVDHGQLPRSRSYLVLNEIEKGSSFITTCLNATSLALLDSGYPLSYYLGSAAIILDHQDGQLYTESEYRERRRSKFRTHEPQTLSFDTPESSMKAKFHFVSTNTDQAPVSVIAEGRFSLNNFLMAQEKSVAPIEKFFEFSKEKVRDRFR